MQSAIVPIASSPATSVPLVAGPAARCPEAEPLGPSAAGGRPPREADAGKPGAVPLSPMAPLTALAPPAQHSRQLLLQRLGLDLTTLLAVAMAGRSQHAGREVESACLLGVAVAVQTANVFFMAPPWRTTGARFNEANALLTLMCAGTYLYVCSGGRPWSRRLDVGAGALQWGASALWRCGANRAEHNGLRAAAQRQLDALEKRGDAAA